MKAQIYSFIASYLGHEGLKGDIYTITINFRKNVPFRVIQYVDKLIKQYHHSIMYSINSTGIKSFIQYSHKIILEDIDTDEITPYVYAYLVLFGLTKFDKLFVFDIQITDSQDKVYTISNEQIDAIDILGLHPNFKIIKNNETLSLFDTV